MLGPRPTVTVQTVAEPDGEVTLLVDEGSGATVSVDELSALVWSLLDGTSSLREIVVDLAGAFGTPADRVGADVVALFRALGRSGLLAGYAAEPVDTDSDENTDADEDAALTH